MFAFFICIIVYLVIDVILYANFFWCMGYGSNAPRGIKATITFWFFPFVLGYAIIKEILESRK